VGTSGRGTVFTGTIVYRSPRPPFSDQTPYTLIVVDVPGVDGRYPARLRSDGVQGIPIGAPVRATFDDVSAEVSLLVWELVDAHRGDG